MRRRVAAAPTKTNSKSSKKWTNKAANTNQKIQKIMIIESKKWTSITLITIHSVQWFKRDYNKLNYKKWKVVLKDQAGRYWVRNHINRDYNYHQLHKDQECRLSLKDRMLSKVRGLIIVKVRRWVARLAGGVAGHQVITMANQEVIL